MEYNNSDFGTSLQINGGYFPDGIDAELGKGSTVTFFGRSGLSYDRETELITSTGSDGTAQYTHFYTNGSQLPVPPGLYGEVLLFGVPEPSSMIMLAVGITGVALALSTKRIRRRLLCASRG